MRTGTVRFWKHSYGFIHTAGGRDYFAHINNFRLDDDLKPPLMPFVGERLNFEVGKDKDGRQIATSIHREATRA
jgi:cold shock CspA family protein